MPAPQAGVKHWPCSFNHGVPTPRLEEDEMADIEDIPEDHPHHKQKEGRPTMKALKEPCCEAFCKESDVVKAVR